MPPDSMTVRLKLKRIDVVEVLTDLPEQLVVVERDLFSVVPWRWCGMRTTKGHETRRVKLKDLPVPGAPTKLMWLRRRFICSTSWSRR